MKRRTHEAEVLETDYLARLRRNLDGRSPIEANDLIQDVREHIEEALSEYTEQQVSGETMSQILAKLGPPEQFLSSTNSPMPVVQTALVIRRATGYFGFLRMLHIIINGTRIIQVRHSEEKSIKLAPGEYIILAKIDWIKSQPIRIRLMEGEKKLVIVTTHFVLALVACFFPPLRAFKLREVNPDDSMIKAKPTNWILIGTFGWGGMMWLSSNVLFQLFRGHALNSTGTCILILITLPIWLLAGLIFGLFMKIWVKRVDKVENDAPSDSHETSGS